MDRPIIRLNGGQLRLSFLFNAPPIVGTCAQVAQLVEHSTENAGVGCSNQPLGTTFPPYLQRVKKTALV